MDVDDILPVGLIGIALVLIIGLGWLISRDQDQAQERAIACIEAGKQLVNGNCVAGPTP